MNNDRVFQSKKEFLLYLLGLMMPNYMIEKVLKISGVTLNNYKKKVGESREWKGSQFEKGKDLPHLLRVYAKKLDQVRKLSDFDKVLLPILRKVLRLDDVQNTLKYGMSALVPLMYPICSDDVLDEYQELITDIVNLNSGSLKIADHIQLEATKMANSVFADYLYAIREGQIPLPKQHELQFGSTEHFVTVLLKNTVDTIRKEKIAPIFGREIIQPINYAVQVLPEMQANIIVLKYGLIRDKGMKLSEVANQSNISWRKAKDYQYKALKNIQKSLQEAFKIEI